MVSEGFQKGLKPCGFRAVSEGSETFASFFGYLRLSLVVLSRRCGVEVLPMAFRPDADS